MICGVHAGVHNTLSSSTHGRSQNGCLVGRLLLLLFAQQHKAAGVKTKQNIKKVLLCLYYRLCHLLT